MAQQSKTQKTLEFRELFYVFRKNWIVELLIFIFIVSVGAIYTRINKDYFEARATIVLNADPGQSTSSYNDTVLSKMYLETISDLMRDDAIIERANQKIEGGGISANDLSIAYNEDSLVIKLTYRDYNKDKAIQKLDTIIDVCIEKTSSYVLDMTLGDFLEMHGIDVTDDKELKDLLNSKLEVVLDEALDDSKDSWFPANIKIVKISPNTTVAGASDDRKIIILAGIFAIICVGAYVILLYFVKDKVSSVERTESITGKKNFVTIEKKKNAGTPLPLGEGEREESYVEIDLRKLSDTLIYMSDGENKVYQIQSGISGEGKTTISTNLAKALGESQRKTLMIDCDFSKPSIHRIFKQHRRNGITDYFKGEMTFDQIVKPTGIENVDLITCGDRIANHTIFFASPKFKAIIEEARTKYDFIILDCAPVKALSDYINISAVSDATLLVVGNDRLSARDLDYTVRELELCNANLIGTVFNFSTAQNKRHYNYYYYYKK